MKNQIYLITGDCEFTQQLAIQDIVKDSAQEIIESAISEEDAIAIASIPNLFNSKTVIFKNKATSSFSKTFVSYLSKKNTKSKLIFVIPKCDKRTTLRKWLYQNAQIIECNQISQWDTQAQENQAIYLSKRVGCICTPAAISELVKRVGNNTRRMHAELQKLKASVAPNPIEAKHVESLVNDEIGNAINLANACRQRDICTANLILKIMDAGNHNPAATLATLITYFKTWLITKEGLINQITNSEIAQNLSLKNPNRIYYLKREVEGCSIEVLKKQYLILLEASINQYPSHQTLVNTIIKLCNQ
ncbi:MAG: DNA polymerase III subunit delta [Cyanobacteria bacterium J06635_10]